MTKPYREPDPPPHERAFRRPKFAERFPREPALDGLVRAFAEGNYALVREAAPKMAKDAEDAAIREAAAELVLRTKPDKVAVWMLAATALLLVALSAYWIVNAHPHDGDVPAPLPPPTVEIVK